MYNQWKGRRLEIKQGSFVGSWIDTVDGSCQMLIISQDVYALIDSIYASPCLELCMICIGFSFFKLGRQGYKTMLQSQSLFRLLLHFHVLFQCLKSANHGWFQEFKICESDTISWKCFITRR